MTMYCNWRHLVACCVMTAALFGLALPATAADSPEPRDSAAVMTREFIFDHSQFASCHASTIAQTPSGLVAAWFGGPEEGDPQVGIWLSRHDGRHWSQPEEVARGTEGDRRYPCWNPILWQASGGPLLLFYKAGPNPKSWWGMLAESSDAGKHWSTARRLPEGILGPIKDKPVLLANNELLCPSSTEHAGWQVHLERTPDLGKSWIKTPALNDGRRIAAIQPSIFRYDDRLQIVCRTRQGRIYQSWSSDQGHTWSELTPTSLPNPNSGIDAVNLKDGRALLVYNHTTDDRSPLNVAVSADGEKWQAALALETAEGEYSYPAVICTDDGLVHITYTWQRKKIRHVVLDTTKFSLRNMPGGEWPAE